MAVLWDNRKTIMAKNVFVTRPTINKDAHESLRQYVEYWRDLIMWVVQGN